MVEVQSLSKRYGEKVAVDDLSFQVRPGAGLRTTFSPPAAPTPTCSRRPSRSVPAGSCTARPAMHAASRWCDRTATAA